VDDHGLRDRSDGILFGRGAVLIEGNIWLEIESLEQALNLLFVFLHIDRHQLDSLIFEIVHRGFDLRHGLDTWATPCGEKVEHDARPCVAVQPDRAAVDLFDSEVGGRLTPERAWRASGAGARLIVLNVLRLDGVMELPLSIR